MKHTIETIDDVSQAVAWLRARVHGRLCTDSRMVRPGDGFIAWPGGVTDGRLHVADALARGACACLVERQGVEAFALPGSVTACIDGLKAKTGEIASQWWDRPSVALKVLAVTGTNGKTSTAWWLAHALTAQGCAMVGTLGIGVPPHVTATGMTTPDPVCLQQAFADFRQQGLRACAIEASSIGIEEHRLHGTHIHTAIFTNLTQDHLDYHGSMAAYWQAKARLFRWPGLRVAVVNVDDAQGRSLVQALLEHTARNDDLDVWTIGITQPARLVAREIHHSSQGLVFTLVEGSESHTVHTRLVGQYNVSNLLGVLAVLRSHGMPLAQAVQVCATVEPVPGRMQQILQPGMPLVVIDYAHTPDALMQSLQALRSVAQERGGKLWCVFGCGGDRDIGKRALMGRAAQQGADRVIVTSDNPRSEMPQAIMQQIIAGMEPGQGVLEQPDRSLAIQDAIFRAAARDVVLLAGKGHEDYQEIQGIKRPFSDMAEAQAALLALAAQQQGYGLCKQ